jgi:uncharacterized membrane protein (DUF485 family)
MTMSVLKRTNICKILKLPKWVYWVWLISIVALGFSVASIYANYAIKWNVEIVSTGIVLGFVGILATFVVVGNYSMVSDIRMDLEKRIEDVEDVKNDLSKRIEDVDEKIALETSISQCLIYIRLSFAYSDTYSYNADLSVYCLAFSIKEYKNNLDGIILTKIIDIAERAMNGSAVFSYSGVNADNYFLREFREISNNSPRIPILLKQIEGIIFRKDGCGKVCKVVFVNGNIVIKRKMYYADIIPYCAEEKIKEIMDLHKLSEKDKEVIKQNLVVDDSYTGDSRLTIFAATGDVVTFSVYPDDVLP